jgi:hypothetical protein
VTLLAADMVIVIDRNPGAPESLCVREARRFLVWSIRIPDRTITLHHAVRRLIKVPARPHNAPGQPPGPRALRPRLVACPTAELKDPQVVLQVGTKDPHDLQVIPGCAVNINMVLRGRRLRRHLEPFEMAGSGTETRVMSEQGRIRHAAAGRIDL